MVGSAPRVAAARCYLIVAAAVTYACPPSACADARSAAPSLTVDDILKLEEVNRVVFSPDGRSMIYEWVPPYESAPNTGSLLASMDYSVLSQIRSIDLTRDASSQQLFSQDANSGYWLGGFSPDGRRLAVFALTDGRIRAGVVDLSNAEVTWFDFSPNYSEDVHRPVWVSNDGLIYAAVLDDDPLASQGMLGYAKTIADRWERTFAGKEPSVTVMTSAHDGLSAVDNFRPGRLMWADAISGKSTEIARGYFHGMRVSPGGRYVAALREAGAVQPGPEEEIDAYAYGPDSKRHQLLIVDTTEGFTTRIACPDCDVLVGSLNWSTDGARLGFLAKGKGERRERAALFEYQPRIDRLQKIDTRGVRLTCGEFFAPGKVHVATLSGDKVVYGNLWPINAGKAEGVLDCRSIAKAEPRVLDTRRALKNDWFALRDREAVNLTSDLRNVEGALLGQTDDAIFVLADGDVWRLGAGGTKRNLTVDVPDSLEPITGYEIIGSLFRSDDGSNGYAPPTDRAVLAGREQVVTIDLRTSRLEIVRAQDARIRVRAVSPAGDRIIVQERSGAAESTLVLHEGQKRRRVLVRLNKGRDLVAAAQAEVTYSGPGGARLKSCLMLPPGWAKGRRYPAIVVTYPDTSGSCFSDGSLTPPRLAGLDTELLAASGYVVLHTAEPSTEVRGEKGRTARLTAVVLAAVDAAINEGYIDPDRLGLIGISQGMHSALQIATETDRFKAVVVGFGISNAATYYNSIPLACRLGQCPPGAAGRYELPLSPNFLGAKPWEAPSVYTDNSPVFHAHRITAPVLLLASDFDPLPNQSEEMFSALYRLRKEAQFAFYWGQEHGVSSPANMRDYWSRILAWYDGHIGSSPAYDATARLP